MIRIAAEHISPRLRYVCRELFGESHEIMHCHGSPSEPPHIWYSASPAPSGSIQIIPHGFLNQTGTDYIDPKPGRVGEMPALFIHAQLPDQFDVFSATFYLLSRYEEYHAPVGARDEMGRYRAESSVLWSMGCLDTPVIEIWRNHLLTLAGQSGDAQRKTHITSTIDIDSAFAYRYKGLYRTIGGLGKDILSLDFKNLFSRIMSLMHLSKDPYDTYALIENLNRERKIPVQWFFLLADFGAHDKGLPYRSKALRALIRRLDGKHQVGIHPGVKSNSDELVLKSEINRLVDITRRPCVHARQHYLILSFPLTYQRYIQSGIRHDYSMGYAEQPGFRAGTSLPFHWYDLSEERSTELLIHPFACMDTTLNKYMGLSPEEALNKLRRIIDNTFEHRGHFISLWHNETLSEKGIWKGWRKVYVEMSDYLAFKRDNA